MLAQVVIYYPCALQSLYLQKMDAIPVSLLSLPKEAHTFWLSEVASNLFTMTHYSLWWNRNITLHLSMFWWWVYFSSLQKWKTVPYMQCGRGHQRWYVCLLNWKRRSIKVVQCAKEICKTIWFLYKIYIFYIYIKQMGFHLKGDHRITQKELIFLTQFYVPSMASHELNMEWRITLCLGTDL